MEPTTPPNDLVQAAIQVYEFSRLIQDSHEEALAAAVASALEAHRAQVISEAADILQRYAEDLSAASDTDKDDDAETGAAYVGYTSELIRKMGHPEIEIGTYTPQDGDLVQVITTGRVTKSEFGPLWLLGLDRGDTLKFDIRQEEPGVRVRLLDRAEEAID